MKKNIENISSAQQGSSYIEKKDVSLLLTACRWGSKAWGEQMAAVECNEAVKGLMQIPHIEQQTIDIERLITLSSADIVDRFLSRDSYKIVAQEKGEDIEVVTEAELTEEDDLVSEELAEIYLKQGLNELAKETYRKLSLLNPEKSVYFAERFEKIESNNQK